MEVAPEESTTPAGLLFTPPGEITGGSGPDLTPVLTVHAGPADRDRDMDETLAEIAAPTGQACPDPGTTTPPPVFRRGRRRAGAEGSVSAPAVR